jgi:hypothetical protein
VETELEIQNALENALEGDTILIADGTYNLGSTNPNFLISTQGITLRSESGNREDVVLDGNYGGGTIIKIASSDVTLADLTVKRSRGPSIHVVPSDDSNSEYVKIYNVHIIDPGQQAIHITPGGTSNFTDFGEIACSKIEMTAEGRSQSYDIHKNCYNAVNGYKSMGWTVRDNLIKGIWCESGNSKLGVLFATTSKDTVVERNAFIDNARAIGFGQTDFISGRQYPVDPFDPCTQITEDIDHYGGIIRNNFIYASSADLFASSTGLDSGIAAWQACGVEILHNSLAFTTQPYSAIEYRWENTDANIFNNITTHNIRMREDAQATLESNLTNQPLSMFKNPGSGDLHLSPLAYAAIDQGYAAIASGLCDDDIDGDTRPIKSARDIGADELSNLVKSVQTGPWNAGATWETGSVPLADDSVVIDTGDQVVLGVIAECASLGLVQNSRLEISGGGRLVISGD